MVILDEDGVLVDLARLEGTGEQLLWVAEMAFAGKAEAREYDREV